MKVLSYIAFGILVLLLAQGCARAQSQQPDSAKPFVLENLNGETVNMGDYLGKQIVLLNFWATWCGYCEDEIPYLKALYTKYKDEMAIFAVDVKESRYKVQSYIKHRAINYPILLDKDGSVARLYKAKGKPTIILINKDKKIIYFGWDIFEAENLIKSLINKR